MPFRVAEAALEWPPPPMARATLPTSTFGVLERAITCTLSPESTSMKREDMPSMSIILWASVAMSPAYLSM